MFSSDQNIRVFLGKDPSEKKVSIKEILKYQTDHPQEEIRVFNPSLPEGENPRMLSHLASQLYIGQMYRVTDVEGDVFTATPHQIVPVLRIGSTQGTNVDVSGEPEVIYEEVQEIKIEVDYLLKLKKSPGGEDTFESVAIQTIDKGLVQDDASEVYTFRPVGIKNPQKEERSFLLGSGTVVVA